MPNSRVFVPVGVFHVVSRVVDRTFRLGVLQKDEMFRLMKAPAAFQKIEIPTYCLMELQNIRRFGEPLCNPDSSRCLLGFADVVY